MGANYDFSGWATKNDLRCSDGRTIRRNAFIECDGKTVPLVWNHRHDGPQNILGHALLENRDEGVYTYCTFNDSESGRNAKELVKHGDVVALSIYANHLRQNGGDVIHGAIREVSLVLAGANPEAFIDTVLEHGSYGEEEGVIFTGSPLEHTITDHGPADSYKGKEEDEEVPQKSEPKSKKKKTKSDEISHKDEEEEKGMANEKEETVQDVFDTLDEKQKKVVYALIGMAIEDAKKGKIEDSEEKMEHADEESDDSEETVQDVFNTLNEKQKKVVYALIGMAVEDANNNGGSEMKHNVFDSYEEENDNVLSHSDMEAIFADANRYGSLKDSALAHGIEQIDYLYPEDKDWTKAPEFIQRETGWVSDFMNGVHHTPFSRVRMTFADITEADARARGYIKGNRKVEEVFGLLRRSTSPTTVYKKQKMDRDDKIDITDFDIVAWLKTEMRQMLDEEIARAALVGDGRNPGSEDKINEQCIRPIWTDDDLFTIKKVVNVSAASTDDTKAKAFIRMAVKARKDYKGSGNPVCFITEDLLTDCLLLEDNTGRIIYDSVEKLATAIRAKKIVSVPIFEGLTRVVDGDTRHLAAIFVNLSDYNIGADKGGAIDMFEDFDIDFNQMKYLIETRCSGALVKPYSAIVIEMSHALYHSVAPEDPSAVLLGKAVSTLQSGVMVHDNFITGNLNYVTGYTGFSGDEALQSGNYLALAFTATEGSTTTVELTNANTTVGPQTLDSDMNIVVRVTNKFKQKIKVVTTKDGISVTNVYSLSSLNCMAE